MVCGILWQISCLLILYIKLYIYCENSQLQCAYYFCSYRVYKARKQLTAIDWNYHINLPEAKSKAGAEIITRRYNRRTRQWDRKKVKVDKGFEYIPLLISKIIHRRLHDTENVTRHISLNASDPGNIAPTIAHIQPPATKDIPTRKSRFQYHYVC